MGLLCSFQVRLLELCVRRKRPYSQSRPLKTPAPRRFAGRFRARRGFKSLLKYGTIKKRPPFGGRFFMVRQMGLEPIRSRTRPSNVPVCQFQHCRAPCHYSRRMLPCQFFSTNSRSATQPVFLCLHTNLTQRLQIRSKRRFLFSKVLIICTIISVLRFLHVKKSVIIR